MSQNKVLVICPTRERPGKLREMIESFQRTAVMSELRIIIDYDDPKYNEYINIIVEHNLTSCIRTSAERKTTTDFINRAYRSEPIFDFYSVTNDDFVYHTPEWDQKLTEEIKAHGNIGIAYGDDGLAGVNMPTTSVISGEIIRAVGWLQLPSLRHLYGDNTWRTVGQSANILRYRPDVKIEHRHPYSGKVDRDGTFERTNHDETYAHDIVAYRDWLKGDAKRDIELIMNINRPTQAVK